jgi:hypothetical protein
MVTLLVLTALALPVPYGPESVDGEALVPSLVLPDHERLSAVLRRVVRGAGVDYQALAGDRSGLDGYLAELAATPIPALESATPADRIAFWVNAYNACMLSRVLDHYPLLERARPGVAGWIQNRLAGRPANSVWRIREVFTGSFCTVAGSSRSLDEIEHTILRPMGEPRIHFAINCAARSCPPLVPEAYTGERLDEQLDARVRAFVADPSHFRFDRETGEMRVNRVLEWFGEDFGGPEGVVRFLSEYLDEEDRRAVGPGTALVHFDYDWTLNDVQR